MAHQRARVCRSAIGNRFAGIWRNDAYVEIHQPFAANIAIHCAHPVRGVTDRTAEAIVDVTGMLAEAGVGQDLRQVMAFRAHRIRPIDTEIRIRKKIRNQLAWHTAL